MKPCRPSKQTDSARRNYGRTITGLAALIAVLIAVTGTFAVHKADKISDEYDYVSRHLLPLAIAVDNAAGRYDTFRARILGEGERMTPRERETVVIDEGRKIQSEIVSLVEKARITSDAAPTVQSRQHGAMIVAGLEGAVESLGETIAEWPSSARTDDYHKTPRFLLGKTHRSLDALRESLDGFLEASADRVEAHERHIIASIGAFAAITFAIGMVILSLIKRMVGLQRLAEMELERLATRDTLTGLYNRRHILERIAQAFASAKRHGQPTSLAIGDLDKFKQINDTYGHQAGDAVLRAFGELLHTTIRTEDWAGRFGGDEFLILFPHTKAADASIVLERIRAALEQITFDAGGGKTFTAAVTWGVADIRRSDMTESDLFAYADEALYDAKARGRNNVAVKAAA
ncbi:MAG: GGDEF domain-containing protein [Deltaproteobacteria bacterium]|nr:GGDEF domain-containing protein [Deltaproteobacteria bacterium]